MHKTFAAPAGHRKLNTTVKVDAESPMQATSGLAAAGPPQSEAETYIKQALAAHAAHARAAHAHAVMHWQSNLLMAAAWQHAHGAMPFDDALKTRIAGGALQAPPRHRSQGIGGNKRHGRAPQVHEPPPLWAEEKDKRSTLLEKVAKFGPGCQEVPLSVVIPHLSGFAQDAKGSEHLVKLLNVEGACCQKLQRAVVDAFTPEVYRLACHPHGHTVIQILFRISTPEQRDILVKQFEGKVCQLTKHKYGCWVIQQALTHCSRDAQLKVVAELECCVQSCIESMHGNHVIQKCIELLPEHALLLFLSAVEADVGRMAVHKYGCRIIQRLLEHCQTNLLSTMLGRILAETKSLAQDPYGNYVLRHLLEFGGLEEKRRILQAVAADLEHLAVNKHASTVVERCFVVAGEHGKAIEETAELARVMLGEGTDAPMSAPLLRLVNDKYGNYVVQRFLEYAGDEQRKRALVLLRQAEGQLKVTPRSLKMASARLKEA